MKNVIKLAKGSLNNIYQDSFNKILSQQLTHDRSYMSNTHFVQQTSYDPSFTLYSAKYTEMKLIRRQMSTNFAISIGLLGKRINMSLSDNVNLRSD